MKERLKRKGGLSFTMRKQSLTLFLLLASALTVVAQDKPERYVDAKGGFSFDVPQGWHAFEVPNAKYKVVFGQRENGFTPNITVEEDSCQCTLRQYVELAQARFEARPQDFGIDTVKLQNKTEFTTASGLKGWKLTNAITGRNLSVVVRQYIFEGKDAKQFIFTCGSLAESASKMESTCDGAIKTLSFTK